MESHRYWNSNGYGVAIVVVIGGVDWAAYIGAQPDPATEKQTVDWVARHGAKLAKEEARAFFDIKAPYRH